MNTDEILRLLTNSGVRVRTPGADSTHIFIEDPSCVLRGFETFLDYAWVVIAIITGVLLFGWAIALIRGSKNNMMINLRNLVIMFGVLSSVGPIINLIWGDDLFARGCRTIAVPIDGVNKVLAARKNASRPTDELYEVLDIHDTGVVNDYAPGADATAPIAAATADGARRAVTATADGADVVYTHSDSTRTRYTDGTRSWRNTNPGNIRFSDFSRRMGAIGRAGGFAVFPDEDAGFNAILRLLMSDMYRNLSIADAISRYAPPFENDTRAYQRRIENLTGLLISRRMSELSDDELRRVATAIRKIEDWRIGRKIELGAR